MKQLIRCVTIMLGLVACGLMVPGCLDSTPKDSIDINAWDIPDPETGVTAWINAVNDRNYSAVYDLMPHAKQAGISRIKYLQFNKENPSPFIASGPVITGYFILEKRVDGMNATIVAGLQIIRAPSDLKETPVNETVFFTFEETFEDKEWKVLTR